VRRCVELSEIHFSPSEHTIPIVSIIIPFFGRDTTRLLACVEAIGEQTLASDQWQLIIVDNNPLPNLRRGLFDPPANVVYQSKRGSYAARNLGASYASAPIIAFTDADCIPNPDWLERGVGSLSSTPHMHVVAGSVDVFERTKYRPNLSEHFDKSIHLRQDRYVELFSFGATANFFIRKVDFDVIGGFDDRFMSGGDREFCERLVGSNGGVLYCDQAIVKHPARSTPSQILIKNIRGVGAASVRLKIERNSWRLRLLCDQVYHSIDRFTLLNGPGHDASFLRLAGLHLLFAAVVIVRMIESLRLICGGVETRQ
jgi:glycosyltransferase involved in cell wall biosynthesis